METVWLLCRETGEVVSGGWATVARVVGVEVWYVAEKVASDGVFENGAWRVIAAV